MFLCSWSGVIGALMRDEAEVGVCTFYWTPSRFFFISLILKYLLDPEQVFFFFFLLKYFLDPEQEQGGRLLSRHHQWCHQAGHPQNPFFIQNQTQVFHQVSWRGDKLADFCSTLFLQSLDRAWRLSSHARLSSHCLIPLWK